MIDTNEKFRPTTGQRFHQRRLGESSTSSTEIRRTQAVVSTDRDLTETKSLDGLKSGLDAGFTLIELMVVLLILAILLAIAIPTFLGVTKSANDRAAQSNLNTALVNAKSIFQQNSHGGRTGDGSAEPSLLHQRRGEYCGSFAGECGDCD
jgi:prepilin-type N-terminal cleavage/methylation domain-containing protein